MAKKSTSKNFSSKSSDKSKKDKEPITKVDSALWGFIILIPFGWILLWININGRRKEAEKGTRTKQSAFESLLNYAVGASISTFAIICMMFGTMGTQNILVPNLVAVIILLFSFINNISRIKKIDDSTKEPARVTRSRR